MTTEIAILNRTGVALAADSAVTVEATGYGGSERKTYNSANKVFTLSKHAPVGIMVYGVAEVLGLPWETIIKMYRHKLGRQKFDALEAYCEDFFAFLAACAFERANVDQFVLGAAQAILGRIRKRLDKEVKRRIDQAQSLDEDTVKGLMRTMIAEEAQRYEDSAKSSVLSQNDKNAVAREYRKRIIDIAKSIFENRPLTTADRSKIVRMIADAASIGPPADVCGVVIAGFGEKEVFPGFFEFDIKSVLRGKVVRRRKQGDRIRQGNEAIIAPFAQSDDVHAFITGMGPHVRSFFDKSFAAAMKETFPDQLSDAIAAEMNLNGSQRNKARIIARKMGEGSHDTFMKALKKVQDEKYIRPIVAATRFLQKSELATMAEAFANMVSFRKQVTLATETVGGPIDVAVITKGDGFIWIRRKHYFDIALNRHFLTTYFEHGDADE